ncbi:MAG: nucleotidyltransferase family protein [candidate division NC10 bacterium]|nr:nucleotidyltransferase family protein [candidate division NC10 bacterium]
MIAAVVLAAGAASRFGEQKLLVPLEGKLLIRWTVEHVLASQVEEVVVVLGREAEAVREALTGLPVRFLVNPRYPEGMSSSLQGGVASLDPAVEAALIVLGDQPQITAAIINRIIETYRLSRKPIVVPVYEGVRGNPVLFDASLFPEVMAVTGDQGAREVIAKDPERVASVPFPFPMPRDVDTPDDYQALLHRFPPLPPEEGG